MKKSIVCIFFLVACQSSSAPVRDFTVTLYKILETTCVKYRVNGEDFVACEGDEDYPVKMIGIQSGDYIKERDYQDLLINRCDKWKD